jgi:putative DNA methylase
MTKPRLLIEEWLPVQAIGIECMRENSTGLHPPPNRLHVWWARRPLTISRAAVLGSLLPADFDRECFEGLLGFGMPSEELVRLRAVMDSGVRLGGFGVPRAFASHIDERAVRRLAAEISALWGDMPHVLDPMAGGGSIPLEAARLGLHTRANELNPVACSILEATVDYPFRFGAELPSKARRWGRIWWQRFVSAHEKFHTKEKYAKCDGYIFARTVPCPDTGHPTPLVPDWSLSRPAGGPHIVAEPIIIDRAAGKWTIRVRKVGKEAGDLPKPPQPTYFRGKGLSLFTNTVIPDDYIKAMAQSGRMGSVLYAVAVKAGKLDFRPPNETDLAALDAAERELARLRPQWEKDGIIPTEGIPDGDKTKEPLRAGMRTFADMFSPRQLLALGTLVEELKKLRPEIIAQEGEEMGEAIVHLLALVVDKFANHGCILTKWECTREVIKGKFDRHDYAFRATFAEMAACVAGSGLEWAIDNVLEAYENLAELPRAQGAKPVTITQGSATNLVDIEDKSITAVVVDPPYADNVQYSELADFFYVWLKRTQGHRRPEWFSSYLCDRDQEAVVNISRFNNNDLMKTAEARKKSHEFYQKLMTDSFREAHRVLRDDGVLTVMFTHKKQEAWASLFESLIEAGFTITATWPVKTESEHSLHIARKNSAQSTVILVARKRDPNAGRAYYDANMQSEIRRAARSTAQRLMNEGLNPVDQLVGTFGPAMQVFTQYEEVRLDTGERVSVADAIQLAADEVAQWRLEQLAARGLEGVDPESRFYLLCWDVLRAEEFRFNEAMLLGRAVGMDVDRLKEFGLLEGSGEKVKILPAASRRRDKPIKGSPEQILLMADPNPGSKNKKSRKTTRKVHPLDDHFSSAIDMCHAIALRYADTGGGDNGIAAAKSMALQMGWNKESPCCKLMEALLNAAPPAVRFPGKKKEETAADHFPEFRAWHAMLKPVFGIDPPEWKEPKQPLALALYEDEEEDEEEELEE